MNRQQRRAAERKTFRAGVKAMAAEVRGAIKLTTVRPIDFALMLADVDRGRTEHLGLMRMVSDTIGRAHRAAQSEPMLCAACPAPLAGSFAVVVAHAARITPKNGLAMGVCTSCGTDLDSIEAAALKGLRSIWPDLKPLTIHEQVGHA